jgi:glycosyltransferase involved in cell wall biosynthesis
VLQWWHPVTAPALLAAVAGLPPSRVAAVCHNARPHEAFPAAAALARAVLGRCGRVLCHSPREAARLRDLLGGCGARIVTAPLPCLVPAPELLAGCGRTPVEAGGRGGRLFVAAGHLRAYKGTDVLLRAWQSARRPAQAWLALVGEWYLHGRAARALRSRIADDPSIVVVDRYVDNVELASWLTLAEAVLAPHLDASQSGILPIAAALGVPAVVSDAGGLAGQAGPGTAVVRAGDPESLRAALERRFEAGYPVDLAARRAAAAGSSVRIRKEWQAVVEAIDGAGRP